MMNMFNCEDCVRDNTDACRFGINKSRDYSEGCPDLLVEQTHAYNKGRIDKFHEIIEKYMLLSPKQAKEIRADERAKVLEIIREECFGFRASQGNLVRVDVVEECLISRINSNK